VSVLATSPFVFGMVFVFLGNMNYLIDSYTIYAASVLAANSIIRSGFGAGVLLFTTYKYKNLGIHWASCVPASLSLACVLFPFSFYRYGPMLRRKCGYAAEADSFMSSLAPKAKVQETTDDKCDEVKTNASTTGDNAPQTLASADDATSIYSRSSLERTETAYDANSYAIDHVNTQNSATTRRSCSTEGHRRGLFGLWRK